MSCDSSGPLGRCWCGSRRRTRRDEELCHPFALSPLVGRALCNGGLSGIRDSRPCPLSDRKEHLGVELSDLGCLVLLKTRLQRCASLQECLRCGVCVLCTVCFLDARRYFGKWPVLKRNPTRCGSRACQTAVVLANPVPEGGTSPLLASWPEKLQAARLPSPVPKSAGAHLGALGVSGSEVFVGRGIWTR